MPPDPTSDSEDHGVTQVHRNQLAHFADPPTPGGMVGLDGLRLVPVPLAPEIRLHLAEDAVVLWARMEAEAGRALSAPFWASAWLGGQALARFVLDHPELVAGRRVLDLASGSGLVGIAARLAGAAHVTANDVDPYAIAAIELNAAVNAVELAVSDKNLLHGDGGDVDVVLAGDVLYSGSMASAVLPFLERATARAQVFIGDPGRATLPTDRLSVVATYCATNVGLQADAEIDRVHVLRPV
jgi:predicted nicotinamide N-methyase